MDVLRACAVQMPHGDTFEENLALAERLLAEAAAGGAQVALLPEYFFAVFPGGPPATPGHALSIRALLRDASARLGIAVAGNVIERAAEGSANVGLVYEDGRLALEQVKIHPMAREAAAGVVGGARLRPAKVRGRGVGMLVCADILYPEAAQALALQGAHLLLNPVMSPWREEDEGREARVAMYVARAYDARAFVLKAAGYRRAAEPPAIAGRSLIAAPWGVLARAKEDFAQELLFADLDFEKLARFREKQAQFPARRPDAYGIP